MRSRLIPLLALLPLVACRDLEPPPFVTDDHVGGSRLAAIRLEGPDGGGKPYGFWDAGRGEECRFDLAGDGEWRCLPSVPSFTYANYFSDDACSVPVYEHRTSACGLPFLLERTETATCPVRKRLFAKGDELLAPAKLYVRDWAGTCHSTGFPPARLFRIGSEVDYAQFVRAVPKRTEPRGELAEEYLAAEDGSRQFTSLRDVAGGRACDPAVAGDGVWRCLPSADLFAAEWLWADDGCVEPAASSHQGTPACTIDRAVLTGPADAACVSRYRIFEVGEEIPSYWFSGGVGCTELAPDAGERNFRLGAEVLPAEFIAATVISTTNQRIRGVELELPGPWRYRDPVVRDAELGGAEVLPWMAADGVERWMPFAVISAAAGDAWYYSDAACTEPLAFWYSSGYCAPSYVEVGVPGTCPRTSRVFEIGELYTGPVWTDLGSACIEEPSSYWALYRIGAEVDPARFAPVVRTLH